MCSESLAQNFPRDSLANVVEVFWFFWCVLSVCVYKSNWSNQKETHTHTIFENPIGLALLATLGAAVPVTNGFMTTYR